MFVIREISTGCNRMLFLTWPGSDYSPIRFPINISQWKVNSLPLFAIHRPEVPHVWCLWIGWFRGGALVGIANIRSRELPPPRLGGFLAHWIRQLWLKEWIGLRYVAWQGKVIRETWPHFVVEPPGTYTFGDRNRFGPNTGTPIQDGKLTNYWFSLGNFRGSPLVSGSKRAANLVKLKITWSNKRTEEWI